MTFSFRWKLFLTFIIYGLALVFITQLVILKINIDGIKSASIVKAATVFHKKNKRFEAYINDVNLKILAFINSKTFNIYLNKEENIDMISSLFLDIANTSDDIMQLRYIDNNGTEKIRINRDRDSSKLYVVKKEDLQNKSNRYYFKDILNTPENKFWYSKVDLNIEHGKIEVPIKPVLRIGMPVYKDKEKNGILVINLFMKDFLHELVDSSINRFYIFDKHGNILVASEHKHCWGKYLDNNYSLLTQFSKDSKKLLTSKEYFGDSFYANKLFLDNSENLRMIVEPRLDYIQQEMDKSLTQLLWIMLGIIIISFPFSYLFSVVPSNLKQKIDEQKKDQDILLSLFDLSDTVLIKWRNDEHWSITYASKSIEQLLGCSQDDFTNNIVTYDSFIHEDDITKVQEEVEEAIAKNIYFFTHSPYRIVSKYGSIKWILDSTVLVKDDNGKLINFVGYISDITEIKNSEERFKMLSRIDQLTNISNRMHLDNILLNQKYRFARDNESASVILIDIDFFKSVNDEFGHLVGDKILIEFSKLLQKSIRESDVLGRWGGEEFLIILPHTNLTQAIQLAQKLQKIVETNLFTTIGHKTASFGVSTFEIDMSIEQLIDYADKALYRSKDSGRNCVNAIQTLDKPS